MAPPRPCRHDLRAGFFTDGALVDARKGSGNFSLAYAAAPRMSAAFGDGRSAVLAAAEAALALDGLNGQREGVTFNVGAIEAAAPSMSRRSGRCCFSTCARLMPKARPGAKRRGALRVAEAAGQRDGISVHLHGGITRPACRSTPSNAQSRVGPMPPALALGLDLAVPGLWRRV
ncbi:MAG: hypothetical protein R3C16_05785 [Hyphomonadaceae bacterium]